MIITRSIKVCSLTAIALLAAAIATPVSAQPAVNPLSSGSSHSLFGPSSLSAAGPSNSITSPDSVTATRSPSSGSSNAALSAPADLDVVQQSIAEMKTEISSNGLMATLPGLSHTTNRSREESATTVSSEKAVTEEPSV